LGFRLSRFLKNSSPEIINTPNVTGTKRGSNCVGQARTKNVKPHFFEKVGKYPHRATGCYYKADYRRPDHVAAMPLCHIDTTPDADKVEYNDKIRHCDVQNEAVAFSVVLGPYEGTVRVPKRSFCGLFDRSPSPRRRLETFHL